MNPIPNDPRLRTVARLSEQNLSPILVPRVPTPHVEVEVESSTPVPAAGCEGLLKSSTRQYRNIISISPVYIYIYYRRC